MIQNIIKILFVILLFSNIGMGLTMDGNTSCTDCHPVGNDTVTNIAKIMVNNSVTKHTIQSQLSDGGPDCVLCHNETNGINIGTIKQSVHRDLNNGATNMTILTDSIDKACWACHGNGTEPLNHPDNYKSPYSCEDCHNITTNLVHTDPSLISNLSLKVFEHVPFPENISSTIVSQNANCRGCHNKSMMINSGNISDIYHYASKTDLVNPTTNCDLCHRNQENANSYWANLIRHPASGDCNNCHNNSRAIDFHSRVLVRAPNIHVGFNWRNDGSPINPNYACISCHNMHGGLVFRSCELCHINGEPSINSWTRSDINDTIPRVYAHTNFSTTINVPSQSGIYSPTRTGTSCYSLDPTTSAGTCHGVSYKNVSAGYFGFRSSTDSQASTSHSTYTIDRLPNTTNCIFCHKQADAGIRFAWGNATQIDEGTHDWYTGNDNSRCWRCHVTGGVAPKDFHSDSMKGGGGSDCISCHMSNDVNTSLFGRHANLNTSDGQGVVSNYDCWTCHRNKDMNTNNIYLCESCHVNNTGIVSVNDPVLIISDFSHGQQTCKSCHAPVRYHMKGRVGPKGLMDFFHFN